MISKTPQTMCGQQVPSSTKAMVARIALLNGQDEERMEANSGLAADAVPAMPAEGTRILATGSIASDRCRAMRGCPKFEWCSAPICPLDPEWHRCTHVRDERICLYLAEAVKPGAERNFEGVGLGNLFEKVAEVIPAIRDRHYPLKKALEQASKSSSRLTRRFPTLPTRRLGHSLVYSLDRTCTP